MGGRNFRQPSSDVYSTTTSSSSSRGTALNCDEYDCDTTESREEAYKFVICVALGFSLMGILTSCLTIPAFYSYAGHMRQFSDIDLTYCHGATSDLHTDFVAAREQWVRAMHNRTKRAMYEPEPSQFISPVGPGGGFDTVFLATGFGFQECPACCVPGNRGPLGDPGLPGMHGAPGPNGAPGRTGQTPNASCIPERIFEPPPCLPCPQGPRGQPGHPGFPGEPGDPGIDGQPGNEGETGNRGPPGVQGPPGRRGPPGDIGELGYTPEAKVIPGPPGEPGDPGPWGLPGHPGLTGDSGFPGTPGERGWPGSPGDPGLLGPRGVAGPPGESGPPGTPGTCVCQETEVVIEDYAQQQYDLNRQNRLNRFDGNPPAQAPTGNAIVPVQPIIPDYPDELENVDLFPEDAFIPDSVLNGDEALYDTPTQVRGSDYGFDGGLDDGFQRAGLIREYNQQPTVDQRGAPREPKSSYGPQLPPQFAPQQDGGATTVHESEQGVPNEVKILAPNQGGRRPAAATAPNGYGRGR